MKRKQFYILISALLILFMLFYFFKGVRFYINKFDKVYDKAIQIKDLEITSNILNLYDFESNKDTSIAINNISKISIVHFWATWCKPYIEEFDSLTKLYKNNKDKIDLYVISEEKKIVIANFLKKNQYQLPFYQLSKKNYFLSVDSLPLPFSCIIIDGKIKDSFIGTYNWSEFDSLK